MFGVGSKREGCGLEGELKKPGLHSVFLMTILVFPFPPVFLSSPVVLCSVKCYTRGLFTPQSVHHIDSVCLPQQ